ncbi:hypothetical protein ACQKOE_07305 [Novosphingobium sp. NPDC080210]|uniref:hypothetical protein n=1 Tax=Novosphingobium sp. NPDC080210 TaxID=3390596 RepID=UPI003D081918
MKVYMIQRSTEDGDSLDLFVVAENRDQAVDLWREWDMVKDFNVLEPDRVWELPYSLDDRCDTPRRLDWWDEVTVCFTGAGTIGSRKVTRDEWQRLAAASGFSYTEKAEQADILVASRFDTTKAVKAAARGVKVMTYQEFHTQCLGIPVNDPWELAEEKRQAAAERVAEKRAARAAADKSLDEMRENPLFGLF